MLPNDTPPPCYPIRSIDEHDVIWIDFGDINKISISHVVSNYHWHMNTDNRPKAIINNMPKGQTISMEAMKMMETKPIVDMVICSAVIVNSKMLKYASRVYMPLHQPPYPVRLFNDAEEALAWVLATRKELASKALSLHTNQD